MRIKTAKSISGIAILEAAGVLIIILTLLIAGFGLVEYMRVSRNLSELLNKYVYETAFKPLRVANNFSEGSGPAISIDQTGLNEHMRKVCENMGTELNDYLSKVNQGTTPGYIIESAYAEIEIDEQSGLKQGINKSSPEFSKSGAHSQIQSYIDSGKKLSQYFDEYSEKTTEVGVDGTIRSYYAVPNAGFVTDNPNYLPSSLIFGAQATVSIEQSLIGSMLQLLGREPYLTETKIVTLRGEINDDI